MPIEVNSASFTDSPARLERWRHIRLTAIELFEARGFADISIDDIARAAGVSRRTFFNYFATKSGVMFDPDPEEPDRLGDLLRAHDPSAEPWSVLTQTLLVYLNGQSTVVTARRHIIGADPALDSLHMLANAQFEESILTWMRERSIDDFRARLTCAIALSVVRESFRVWEPDSGYAAFMARLVDGFAFAGRGADFAAREQHDVSVSR